MKKRMKIRCLLFILIFIVPTFSPPVSSQNIDDYEVTGVTVYRVYPFEPTEEYGISRIFFKNYSYTNFSINIPWSTPFSFDQTKRQMVSESTKEDSFISQKTITFFSRNGKSSQNEYIFFEFKDNVNYKCIIFPTMVIGIGEITDTNEYISISEMNQRRGTFLSFFEEFIMKLPELNLYFQQNEFLSGESLPRESMVWTRIIRVTPNFNYLTNEQLVDFLYFKSFEFEKTITEDKLKMVLSCSISPDYINEFILFDGYNLASWKTYYNYPLGLNENIMRLRMLTELNYVLLPFGLNELSLLQDTLDSLENKLISLNGKSPDEIKRSGIFEELTDYKSTIRELQHLDINMKLRNTDTLFEAEYRSELDYHYEKLSVYLDDINTQYYSLKENYNNLLNSAYTDSALNIQFWMLIGTIILIFLALAPRIYEFLYYHISKPKFTVHFKPASGHSFKEEKKQEISLHSNKKELIWIMLHNKGKSITHNWQCIIHFDKTFKVIPINYTEYKDIDFKKDYTIQKKYSAAHFNSLDFNPIFPHDETYVFPVVVKTPKNPGNYQVNVVVYSGNHKNKFIYHMSISI